MNPNEVRSVRYVTQDELRDMFRQAGASLPDISCLEKLNQPIRHNAIDEGKIEMTPWFRLIVEKFLYSWWTNLDGLESMRDAETIHRL